MVHRSIFFGAWASLLGFHLEVLNWTSMLTFYSANVSLKNVQKNMLAKIFSVTFELQEQYCESLFVWEQRKEGYLTISLYPL